MLKLPAQNGPETKETQVPGVSLVFAPLSAMTLLEAEYQMSLALQSASPELSDPQRRLQGRTAFAVAYAGLAVIGWTGIGGDDGTPAPVTAETVAAALRLPPIAAAVNERINQEYNAHLELVAEKNG